jgi:selenocysteine-specific elongation factor
MIIGTAGHIDHGKTALVRALTGVDTDRLPEEKRRGITIDLGFAPLELPELGVAGIVDVPGHEAFVRTMLAGASGIDVALLVVAADEGVMPQTREHLAILELLGVPRGVVAITKADLVDDAMCELVAQEVALALAGTALEHAPAIAVSVITGRGLDALRDALTAAARNVAAQSGDEDLARLPVDRVFTKAGTGTVVTGTLWSGVVRVGDEVTLLPSGLRARVRGLQVHGAAVDHAASGTRVAVALAGADRADVERGETLTSDEAWTPSLMLRADVALLGHAAPLTARSRVRFHLGTREVGARIVCAGGPLRAGERRAARVVLDAPVVAMGGDRFVLRRPSPQGTIGGGVVTDANPGRRRTRPFDAVDLTPADRLARVVNEGGIAGVNARSLAVRVGLSPQAVLALVGSGGTLVQVGAELVAKLALDATAKTVLDAIDAHHLTRPRDAGAPLESVRALCRASAPITGFVIDSLVREGAVAVDGPTIRRASWRPATDEAADARKSALLARLEAAAAAVPTTRELEAEVGFPVVPVLRQLEREKLAVALSTDRFTTAPVVASLRAHLSKSLSPTRVYTPSELRVVFGISRQFLIPWLEYFDRQGFSQREGEGRRFRV